MMKNLQMIPLKKLTLVLIFVFSIGFIGCETDDSNVDDNPVEKYLGTWKVSDQPARLNYEVIIERNPANTAYIFLKNFADLGGNAVGLVVGNSVIIDKQTLVDEFQVEGTGSYISSTELKFEYSLDDGIDIENRIAVFSK